MNVEKMQQMIEKAKSVEQLHLSAQQGFDQLTGEDIVLFVELLKRRYADVTDLSLEDLSLTDAQAVGLVDVLTFLPLEHFSLQGEGIGDRCIERLGDVFSNHHSAASQAIANSSPSVEVKSNSEGEVTKFSLQSLIIGGYAATDAGLRMLTTFILANPGLKKCSVNWSPLFSITAALEMVKKIAVANVGLNENDFHGFFHAAGLNFPKALGFINGFFESLIKRNARLEKYTKHVEKIAFYEYFFNNYHQMLRKNFVHTQRLYALYGFHMKDIICAPLTGEALARLLHGQAFDGPLSCDGPLGSPRLSDVPSATPSPNAFPVSEAANISLSSHLFPTSHLRSATLSPSVALPVSASTTPVSGLVNAVLPVGLMTPLMLTRTIKAETVLTPEPGLPPAARTLVSVRDAQVRGASITAENQGGSVASAIKQPSPILVSCGSVTSGMPLISEPANNLKKLSPRLTAALPTGTLKSQDGPPLTQ